MDKVIISEFSEDFTETARKKTLSIFNINDSSVELYISTTSPLVKLQPSRVTIAKQKKLPLTVELQGKINKTEAIIFELLVNGQPVLQTKKFVLIKKDGEPWKLVLLTPVILGFFVMELIIKAESYFSPNSLSPWFYFFFGLVILIVQIKFWI